jgi:predicted outer membrane repeat protein
VPAGNHAIFGSVRIINQLSAGDAFARCVMRVGGILVDDTDAVDFDFFGDMEIASLQAFGQNLAGPTTILIECNESSGSGGAINVKATVTAIRVASIQ